MILADFSQTLRQALRVAMLGVAFVSCGSISAQTQTQTKTQAANVQTNKALTPAERKICQDLDACVDILLRHAPDGFDYAALSQDFQRFGPPALQRLLQLMASDREAAVTHAQAILSLPSWQFPPAAQEGIANLWPRGDIGLHSAIMLNINTPLMRDRAIATLSHPNADARAQSREVLKKMGPRAGKKTLLTAPVPQAAFNDLAKAAVADPTPEIIALIGSFPQGQSKPVLTRFLLSDNADITREAYAQLYRQKPDMALSAFKATLPNLKTPRQALALSKLLQTRHVERQLHSKDGFYMHLAYSLLTDKTMSPLGQMMAMDAILNSPPLDGKTLPNSPQMQAIFKNLIDNSGAYFFGYGQDFEKKAGANTAKFLPIIWAEILRRESKSSRGQNAGNTNLDVSRKFDLQAYGFIQSVNALPQTPELRAAAIPILREALQFNKDWRVQAEAIKGLALAKYEPSRAMLVQFAQTHPIVDVRGTARAALSFMSTNKTNRKIDWQADLRAVKAAAQYCRVEAFDFKGEAGQLPFFEGGVFVYGDTPGEHPAHRRNLATAFPTQAAPNISGWFAGYNAREYGGGLLYYDNESGAYDLISAKNTLAITPVKPTPLGTYASEFWVVQGDDLFGSFGLISYLNFHEGDIRIRRHFQLPATPEAINVLPDQSLHIGFSKAHPPLRLLPNGRLVEGCARANSSAPKTLPK